jgi:hypothetical protein
MTESRGHGDLRFYALVQFLPMLLIPMILLLYRNKNGKAVYFWSILVCYLLAKIFEFYDEQIFKSLTVISGHSLKHLVVALVPVILILQDKTQAQD